MLAAGDQTSHLELWFSGNAPIFILHFAHPAYVRNIATR